MLEFDCCGWLAGLAGRGERIDKSHSGRRPVIDLCFDSPPQLQESRKLRWENEGTWHPPVQESILLPSGRTKVLYQPGKSPFCPPAFNFLDSFTLSYYFLFFQSCDYCRSLLKSTHKFGAGLRASCHWCIIQWKRSYTLNHGFGYCYWAWSLHDSCRWALLNSLTYF